jgi:hypothetical protein
VVDQPLGGQIPVAKDPMANILVPQEFGYPVALRCQDIAVPRSPSDDDINRDGFLPTCAVPGWRRRRDRYALGLHGYVNRTQSGPLALAEA